MFDFLGKKPTNKGRQEPRTPAVPNSLLDVVVPFPPTSAENLQNPQKKSPHDSLLSQFDVLAQERLQMDSEKQAAERANMRAKKAAFEQSEQLARIEADRDASLRFEEKANKLAAEIERVREAKFHQAHEPRSNSLNENYPRAHNNQPSSRNDAPYDDRRDREQFERFQQWQMSNDDHRYPSGEHEYYEGRAPADPSPEHYSFDRRGQIRPEDTRHRHGRNFDGRSDQYRSHDSAMYAEHERPTHPQQMHGHYQPQHRAPQMASPSPVAPPRPVASAYYPEPVPNIPEPAKTVSTGGLYGQNQSVSPSSSSPGPGPASGIDLDKIFSSILGSWKMVGFFAVVGAVIAGVYAKTLPNKYEAWAELLIDPQGITLIDKQLSSTGYGGEAMIAYLESQLRIIESTSVLNVVIDKEELYDDPEFSSSGSAGTGLLNILNPLSNGEKSSRDRQYIIDNLQDKLTIARGSRTFIVSIGMITEDGEKSARIANAIAKAYVNGESGARSKVARDASENLSDKLETLRNRVLSAERKVADYKAENGLVTSEGKLISEVRLSRINEQLAIASIETVNAKTRMEQLRKIDLSDVISGALPASLNTGTLSQLRIRYATLKSTADRLSTKLGPKHPERIAASAELESARGQISREIRRSIAGSRKDLERAKERQKGLNQQLNTVKATVAGTGNSLIDLRELERELEAHKSVYENYLLRSRETSEQEGLTTTNARVITVATAPLEKASPNRKVIAGVGLIAGGLLGLVLALLKGLFSAKISARASEKQDETDENASYQPNNIRMNNPNYAYPDPYAPASAPVGGYAPQPPNQPPRYR